VDHLLLAEEQPEAYKNIDSVVEDLVDKGVVDVMVVLRPLLTCKTMSTEKARDTLRRLHALADSGPGARSELLEGAEEIRPASLALFLSNPERVANHFLSSSTS